MLVLDRIDPVVRMELHRVAAAGEAQQPAPDRQTVLHPRAGAHLVPLPVHTLALVRTAQCVHVVLELGLGMDWIVSDEVQ